MQSFHPTTRRRNYGFLSCLLLLLSTQYGSAWMSPKFSTRTTTNLYDQSESSPSQFTPNNNTQSTDLLFKSEDDIVLDAVAAMTQQSCALLGLKSVGVDYGLVRTGLAATVGYEPKPIGIVSNLDNTQVCQEVIRHCRLEQASQIVLGLPLHKNGTEAEQTILTKAFAKELAATALRELGPDVPVVMWDERYTSKFAAARAMNLNPERYLYGTLDADAACIILEHFYQNNGKGAHPVELEQDVANECLQLWQQKKQLEDKVHQEATEQRLGGKSTQRQEAMERARKLEEEMQKQGLLGVSRKKKKQKKKKREKRGPWLSPGQDPTSIA